MNGNKHNDERNPTRYPEDAGERREASLILAIIFVFGLGATLLLTLGGAHALVQLVAMAGTFKSTIITGVLGMGLVVLGPVLLLALAVILPRWWFRDMKTRVAKLLRVADS
jgi:hypothetical protein